MVLRINVCKKVKFAYFYKFNTLPSLRWKTKTSNSLTILTLLTNRANSHSNTLSLDLQSSIPKMKLEGSKMRVNIDIIGEGKLKGHQINGSLPLGNIIVHLTLPN